MTAPTHIQKDIPDVLLYENHGDGVATITLNRPTKLNALIPQLIIELCDLIDEIRADHSVRAVVLRGAGTSFCAGDDLHPEERFRYGQPDLLTRMKTGYPRIVLELLQLRKPIVAMLHGYAVGAGMDVSLACDFRIAAPNTKMASMYVKRGMGGGCTYLLPRYVGFGKATEMLLLGETVDAEECLKLGLVNKVVEESELENEVYTLARRLAKGPTAAYGAIKNSRNQCLGDDPVKGIEKQVLCNVELMLHKDAREGARAFREKRQPVFTGEWIDLQYDPIQQYASGKE